MGFIENFKIKRAAKKAKAVYEAELNEWERENSVLNAALDIFTSALKGEEPNGKLNEEIESLQSKIDILVYELYEIESSKIKIIENTF